MNLFPYYHETSDELRAAAAQAYAEAPPDHNPGHSPFGWRLRHRRGRPTVAPAGPQDVVPHGDHAA